MDFGLRRPRQSFCRAAPAAVTVTTTLMHELSAERSEADVDEAMRSLRYVRSSSALRRGRASHSDAMAHDHFLHMRRAALGRRRGTVSQNSTDTKNVTLDVMDHEAPPHARMSRRCTSSRSARLRLLIRPETGRKNQTPVRDREWSGRSG
jgi:hypothetical protein